MERETVQIYDNIGIPSQKDNSTRSSWLSCFERLIDYYYFSLFYFSSRSFNCPSKHSMTVVLLKTAEAANVGQKERKATSVYGSLETITSQEQCICLPGAK